MFINHYSIIRGERAEPGKSCGVGRALQPACPFGQPTPSTSLRSFELRPGWQEEAPGLQQHKHCFEP